MSERPPPAGDTAAHAVSAQLIHDLRTPLSQIIGYSEMLMEHAEQAGDEGYATDLGKVRAAGYRLLELINEHFRAAPAPAAELAPPATGAARLADFIVANREAILAEWEAFARTCAPASGAMDVMALRDHAGEMLAVIAADLRTWQSPDAQSEKSKGNAPGGDTDTPTAAEEHGAGRAESGFTVEQMVSEYRALRASVIRLWTKSRGELGPADLEDLTRFNAAIDQSLAESISRYTEELDHSKEMFLAILGHDLRTPLGAVMTSAKFMLETQGLKEPSLTLTSRIASSATRMVHMVGDLLDFTRSRLGGGIPVVRAEMNMARAAHDVVDEISAAHPDRMLQVETRDEAWGEWDCARITQVLTNLLANALEHGAPGSAVRVCVQGDGDEVTITIHNRGPAIPPHRINGIFNPMKPREGAGSGAAGPSGNLGLGLYIAERIVNAHQGRIEVESSEEHGTTFTVRLPRRG
ncbi:MAG TPA: ATP-binding protein [Longimicrobium sp.]|nr:ATP-binding protein [Longimicrobium sp.]